MLFVYRFTLCCYAGKVERVYTLDQCCCPWRLDYGQFFVKFGEEYFFPPVVFTVELLTSFNFTCIFNKCTCLV